MGRIFGWSRSRPGPFVRRAGRDRLGEDAGRSSRAARGLRSLAGQMFTLMAGIVALLVAAAGVALIVQARHDAGQEARRRSLAVAETFAHAPGVRDALASADPSAVLQPLTEAARHRADVDFIVVMSPEGIRFTHRDPDKIGQRFSGTIGPAAEGRAFTETHTGPTARSIRAVVPVTGPDGTVVGLVASGVEVEDVTGAVRRQLPVLLGGAAAGLALGTGCVALVGRRLRRQTHGLEPAELTRLYEHHEAVLHSVREGLLIVAPDGHLLLTNDEARRLLGLPPDAEGRPVGDLGPGTPIAELLASGRLAVDEVHPSGEFLLAVNQRPTRRDGRTLGTVVTLRDTTELRALADEVGLARERLRLLYDAGVGVGTTLDVTRTAEELARVTVPRLADFVAVDLCDPVLRGRSRPRAGPTCAGWPGR